MSTVNLFLFQRPITSWFFSLSLKGNTPVFFWFLYSRFFFLLGTTNLDIKRSLFAGEEKIKGIRKKLDLDPLALWLYKIFGSFGLFYDLSSCFSAVFMIDMCVYFLPFR